VAGPWITEREVALVAEAARSGWYEDSNLHVERFERAFARHTGRAHAIALPSCTSAIHLALAAAGIGPGDEVIVPELTWIATVAPVHYVGATPVFADVEPDHWCVSPESVESLVGPRTRAVVGVDLYGNLAAWDRLEQIAARRGLLLVEDAAEALGAEWGARRAGSFGDAAVFSFHGSKTLTTGEGGMLVTDRRDLLDRALVLRDHGRAPGDRRFRNIEVGYKYKMCALQAALGLAQLERLDELVARKRAILGQYRRELAPLGVRMNADRPGTRGSCWMSTMVWDGGPGKDGLMDLLAADGIDTRPFFHPLSGLPAYLDHPQAQIARARNHASRRLSARGINLPSALRLGPEEVARVADSVRRHLPARARGPGLEPGDVEPEQPEAE
jgi:perosamine synthetase